jgi:hypothetical protein
VVHDWDAELYFKKFAIFLNGLSNHRSQQRDLESRIRTCD